MGTAIDDIIGASCARGADRHTLLKMVAKGVSPTAHLYHDTSRLSSPRYMDDRQASPREFSRQSGDESVFADSPQKYKYDNSLDVMHVNPEFTDERPATSLGI